MVDILFGNKIRSGILLKERKVFMLPNLEKQKKMRAKDTVDEKNRAQMFIPLFCMVIAGAFVGYLLFHK
jgi:hypothetical protein